MNIIKTKLSGVVIIEPKVFHDFRGYFLESFNQRKFAAEGLNLAFVQDNISRSAKGTMRGLHYQLAPQAQGKLVTVSCGAIFDVAVDIRKGSPTFGQWFGAVLSDENRQLIYVPEGFAHGFCVLSDMAEVTYKCTNYYSPENERSIVWSDPQLDIAWPVKPELVAPKDANAPCLKDAQINFVYQP